MEWGPPKSSALGGCPASPSLRTDSVKAVAHLCYILLFFDRLPYTCSSNPRRCGLRTALIQNLTVRCPVINRDGVAPLLLCDLVALHFFGWGSGVGKKICIPDTNHFVYISSHILKLGPFYYNKIGEFKKNVVQKWIQY
jgi:hypothetical protein